MTDTSAPKPDKPARTPAANDEEAPKSLDEELDKALADSFPASDPPAPAIKGTAKSPTPSEKGSRR